MMQDYELTAWLGDSEPTDGQREQIARAAAMIETRYPVPADGEPADVMADREQALSGAVQVILGDSTPDELAQTWLAAARAAAEAHAVMAGAIIAESLILGDPTPDELAETWLAAVRAALKEAS